MRVAVLWSGLSGYLNACLRELAAREGVELFVSHMRPLREAPYDEAQFDWIADRYPWQGEAEAEALLLRLERFRPDVILCVNWHYRAYRHAMRRFKGRAVRIFTSDRQWQGTMRQWLGVLTSRIYLRPLCEAIFVAGEPQVAWARQMGFRQEHILQGMLSCDHDSFAAVHAKRQQMPANPHAFVFVGRLAPEKGLDVLIRAYAMYRRQSAAPWPLRCFGTGPLRQLAEGAQGVECMGFVQPDALPAEFARVSCLVLPSTFEPWALVVHEATAAGMGVIASDAVGAAAHLLRSGENGYIVKSGDAGALAAAMLRYAGLDEQQQRDMGEKSFALSRQFTPARWADTLLSRSQALQAHLEGVG